MGQSRIEQFLSGEMTAKQLEKLANLSRVPFGFFFLSEPPVLQARIPDLRQAPYPTPLTSDFWDTLDDVQAKQSWYEEYVTEMGLPDVAVVGSVDMNAASPAVVASQIKSSLGVTAQDRASCGTPAEYFSLLSERIETLGILVFKNGVVGFNNKRQLSVSEFRGFALADKKAPLIFINGHDAEAAWVFTLLHELAHIWVGESGVSDTSVSSAHSPHTRVERYCNQVAAEFLTPVEEFQAKWAEQADAPFIALSRHFKVSSLVIARRAFDFGYISWDEYVAFANSLPKKKGTGGDFWRIVPVKNSKRFTRAIVNSAMNGRTMLREAAGLLHVKPDGVFKLDKQFKQ
ncbi:hypothetical protein WG78_13155 [Amantichitinum ursilacus]|uniref:IrrE N-terminal-like domain-containing protein n=1 Tax=Amantichitinum ursilacus TaxID=857265 RepID=A0A0N0GMR5_9NEIS|nr:hypothetical protein WG78_13155 [Amantichitinum ursilacus]